MNMYYDITRPIVKVKEGALQGILQATAYGGTFYVAFLGIPFAEPPIGHLRFKDPKPPASWSGVREATTNVSQCCIQIDLQTWPQQFIIGQEDCLYLDVYTPYPFRPKKLKPVMVWIHGGNFNNGTGNSMKMRPDYLIAKGVVLVIINYRLGALGFLNIGHEAASGNQGLKDQVAAFKWVKENIAAFGGDPTNITAFGSGTGAVFAHLLILSPLSEGLIHKAILQSGVASMKWMMAEDTSESNAFKLARRLNIMSTDPEEIVTLLQKKSATAIVLAQYKLLIPQEQRVDKHVFGPSLDKKAKKPFLPRRVWQLYDNGNNIPIMLGYTSLEYMGFLRDTHPETLNYMYSDLQCYVKRLLRTSTPSKIKILTKLLKKTYFNNQPFILSSIPAVLRCMSNIHFTIPIMRYADERRKTTKIPTYLYQFSYSSKMPRVFFYRDSPQEKIELSGACHGDEIRYLFYIYKSGNSCASKFNSTDFKILETLTTMWTNFAKKGNPTPYIDKYVTTPWIPVTADNFYYLDIHDECNIFPVSSENLHFR